MDLMKQQGVHAIIGPQYSSQAKFVIDLGEKAQIPIISFSATSSSLSPAVTPYFVRTAQNDSSQVKALASIIENYGWRDIALIHEDSEYGNGLVPYLLDAFQGVINTTRSSIPVTSNETEIRNELRKLKGIRKFVFLVHMKASIASTLFLAAEEEGMMREGYAWLVTEGLSTLLDPVDDKAMDSMTGVLGLKPHIKSEKIKKFNSRWKKYFTASKRNNNRGRSTDVTLFGLWAYDTIWALATAVEKAGIVDTRFSNKTIGDLPVSPTGPKLLRSIRQTNFPDGLSGEFSLADGELLPSAFDIFNVVARKERTIGYWTRKTGLSTNLHTKMSTNSKSKRKNTVIWPGDPAEHHEQPRVLRIGVPYRDGLASKFVKVVWDRDNHATFSGFSIDIFRTVVDRLPFPLPFEFIPYVNQSRQPNGTYTELLMQIKNQTFDAVVGDTTIVAERTAFVDFTLPYFELSVSMLVLMKHEEKENMWIFLKPLRWDLWLVTGFGFVITGFVVWVLEHRGNTEFRGPLPQQIGIVLWFSFSTLFFAHRERVMNNWTRAIVLLWAFLVLIVSQSYTASLASMLTVQRMHPVAFDVKEILRNNYAVGYPEESFVKEFLKNHLGFREDMLRSYNTVEDYHDALVKGTHNGGVIAIFDELPFIQIFLAKYCSNKFQMVGPTYQTAGFGFAFPIGSPLVSHISRAILNITQDQATMDRIEVKNSDKTTCKDNGTMSSSSSGSLKLSSFGGLFIITGVATILAFVIYAWKFLRSHWPEEGSFGTRTVELVKRFYNEDKSAGDHGLKRNTSGVHPETIPPSTNGRVSLEMHTIAPNLAVVTADCDGDNLPSRNNNAGNGATMDAPNLPA